MSVLRSMPLALLAIMAVCPPGASPAAANNGRATGELIVGAVIAPSCQIVEVGTLEFGTVAVDSSSVDRVANLLVRCSVGTSYAIKINAGEAAENGTRRLKHESGSATLVYRVSQDAGHTREWGETAGAAMPAVGTGANQDFPIYGRLEAPAATGSGLPRAGRYADKLTVTLEY